jgi:hypothetical protein
MNPYASYLGTQDPMQVLAATPVQFARFLHSLGHEGADRAPAPGKWAAREILCHLADTELAFGFRLRQALAEEHHVIQPFDQDRWAERYQSFDARQALQVFAILRGWNTALLDALPREAFSRPVTHPERGEMTFATLVETMAGHDLNHLRQMEALVNRDK